VADAGLEIVEAVGGGEAEVAAGTEVTAIGGGRGRVQSREEEEDGVRPVKNRVEGGEEIRDAEAIPNPLIRGAAEEKSRRARAAAAAGAVSIRLEGTFPCAFCSSPWPEAVIRVQSREEVSAKAQAAAQAVVALEIETKQVEEEVNSVRGQDLGLTDPRQWTEQEDLETDNSKRIGSRKATVATISEVAKEVLVKALTEVAKAQTDSAHSKSRVLVAVVAVVAAPDSAGDSLATWTEAALEEIWIALRSSNSSRDSLAEEGASVDKGVRMGSLSQNSGRVVSRILAV
jgi:hypothetical protein